MYRILSELVDTYSTSVSYLLRPYKYVKYTTMYNDICVQKVAKQLQHAKV